GIQWVVDNPTNTAWDYVYQALMKKITVLDEPQRQTLIQAGLGWLADNPSDKDWSFIFEIVSQRAKQLDINQWYIFLRQGLDWIGNHFDDILWHAVYTRLLEQKEWFNDEQQLSIIQYGLQWLSNFSRHDKWHSVYVKTLQTQNAHWSGDQQFTLINMGLQWLSDSQENPKWYVVFEVLLQLASSNMLNCRKLVSLSISWMKTYATSKGGLRIYSLLMNNNNVTAQDRDALSSISIRWLRPTHDYKEWAKVYETVLVRAPEWFPDKHHEITLVGIEWLQEYYTTPEWVFVYQALLNNGVMGADEYRTLLNNAVQWLANNQTNQRWNYIYQALMDRPNLPDTIYQTLIAQGLQWLANNQTNQGWAYVLKALLQTSDRLKTEDLYKARELGFGWLKKNPSGKERNEVFQILRQFIDFSMFQEGDVMTGEVIGLPKVGALVSLDTVEGLLPVSKIVHRRIKHPKEVLSIGDDVTVFIEKLDQERKRIELNRRILLPDPLELFTARHQVGDIISGTVSTVAPFSILVKIQIEEDFIEGLLHKSEMQSLGESQPGELFNKGDAVHQARIIHIDAEKHHVKLSLDALPEEEWQARQQSDHSGGSEKCNE
ncbi:MAG: S1 RNA-binding domain-containing protein, partial [Chloroflexota bacterium]